jgi:hypothetical protein
VKLTRHLASPQYLPVNIVGEQIEPRRQIAQVEVLGIQGQNIANRVFVTPVPMRH